MISYSGLTDRQNKFLDKICSLCLASSNVTPEERGYLQEAKVKIISGWDFKWSINGMNLGLKEIDDGKLPNIHLSADTKVLYQELIAIYGEPDPGMPLPPEEKRPKNWMDSDPDLVFIVAGRGGDWAKRKPEPIGKSWWINYFGGLLQVAVFALLFLFLLVGAYPPVKMWLDQYFGRMVWEIFIGVSVVIFLTFKIITGNLRRKKKK
ncbi:hypothetical protein [Lactovum odontotermitis]